jgi:Polymer-forming cytoskeletal
MPRLGFCDLLLILFLSLALGRSSAAEANAERFQMNHDIQVHAEEKTGDLTCFNCSVRVRGQVAGDIFCLHGNVIVEQNGRVAGDVATLLGDVRLDNGTQVAGDIAAIGGSVKRDSGAAVTGDVAALGGAGWFTLIFFVPLAVVGGIIALIVWLVQRSRHPATATV